MENEINVVLLGLIGAVISPIVTLTGLYLQFKRDKIKAEAELKKEDADAEKTHAEAVALGNKTGIETVNFYASMLKDLRVEIAALTELGKKNVGEIAILSAKLAVSDMDKERLAKENLALLERIDRYEVEVRALRKEVADLKIRNMEDRRQEDGITKIA